MRTITLRKHLNSLNFFKVLVCLRTHTKKANPMIINNETVDLLNELLAGELTAIDQYLAHAEIYDDLGLGKLAAHTLHESEHEREHARAMIQRILMLEGKPDLSKRHEINMQTEVEAMLKADLAVEYSVMEHLREAVAKCEALKDFVTRDMLVAQLDDTETDHAYFLEKQLRLINQIGLPNYMQSQMGDANNAG